MHTRRFNLARDLQFYTVVYITLTSLNKQVLSNFVSARIWHKPCTLIVAKKKEPTDLNFAISSLNINIGEYIIVEKILLHFISSFIRYDINVYFDAVSLGKYRVFAPKSSESALESARDFASSFTEYRE